MKWLGTIWQRDFEEKREGGRITDETAGMMKYVGVQLLSSADPHVLRVLGRLDCLISARLMCVYATTPGGQGMWENQTWDILQAGSDNDEFMLFVDIFNARLTHDCCGFNYLKQYSHKFLLARILFLFASKANVRAPFN